MLKLWGAGLILTAPVLLSLSRWSERRRQDKLLDAFCKALELCAGQIRCSLTPLPDLAALLERHGPETLRPFWQTIRQGISCVDADVDALWRDALSETGLPAQVLALLAPFPQALRSYDTDKIVLELERICAETAQYRVQEAETFRRDFRLHTGIQTSAALLLLILLF